jgi:hypothetical protein
MIAAARVVAAIVVVVALGGGCSYHVFSPPARMIAAESAEPVKPGEMDVGGHVGAYSAIFEPGVVVASGNVGYGVAPNVEANFEGTYGHLNTTESPAIDRDAYTARMGAKIGNQLASFTVGLGGGLAPALGSFVAVDIGAIISAPNCYVVPFLAPSAFVSAPLFARTVIYEDLSSSRPLPSAGFGVSGGIEIDLSPVRCREGHTPARLQLGVNFTDILGRADSVDSSGIEVSGVTQHFAFGLVAGVEVRLGR